MSKSTKLTETRLHKAKVAPQRWLSPLVLREEADPERVLPKLCGFGPRLQTSCTQSEKTGWRCP